MSHFPKQVLAGVGEFRQLFNTMICASEIETIGREHHSGRGAPPKVGLAPLVMGLVHQELQGVGTRSQHLWEVGGQTMDDSSISQRLLQLDRVVFTRILDTALGSQADLKRQPEAFYHGRRLLGIDGTRVSLANTAAVNQILGKAASRRGKAAFAQLDLCLVGELSLHNPVVAAIGEDQESEMLLATEVFGKLPAGILLLGDRYYGVGRCISQLLALCQKQGVEFLFRVRSNLKARLLESLGDGSARVEVQLATDQTLTLREIRGRIRARDGRWIPVRLWTNLMDVRQTPAAELLELYGRRWEQEIATDELKNKLRRNPLLKSQTPHTAVQELAALVMAQAIVARVRMTVAIQAKVPTLRVSFLKTLHYLQGLWMVVESGHGILSPSQITALVQRVIERISRQLTPPRRKRSCPRAVRKPVGSWPRLLKPASHNGEFLYQVTKL